MHTTPSGRSLGARIDVMWDNIGTVHNAVADYLPNEPRTMLRV